MRQFYVSLITSSFICLSIASASSVIEEAQTAVTSSTSISATTSHVTPKDDLTSFTARLKVVREYYGENPNNPDLGILSHLVRWHDQDVKAIRSRLTSPAHQSKLDEYHVVAAQAAATQKLNFESLGLLHLLYAQLQSDDLEPRTPGPNEGAEVASILHFVEYGTHDAFLASYLAERQKSWNEWADFAKDPFYLSDVEGFLSLYAQGVRPLPMVSKDANATFRELNESFGLGKPLLGDPLERANYDGNLEALQKAFYGHDFNHARQTLYYSLYRQLNQIIYEIKDPKRQFLCDFVLFDMGHEQNFFMTLKDTPVTIQTLSGLVKLYIEYYDRDFEKLTQPQFLERGWPSGKFDKDHIPNGLMPFMDPETGKLNSLESLIIDKKLPQNRPLQFNDFYQGSGFKNKLDEYESPSMEAQFHLEIARLLANYNKLLELEGYFQKNGLPEFKLWQGDKFDSAGILGELGKAGAIFLEEVRPKFSEDKSF